MVSRHHGQPVKMVGRGKLVGDEDCPCREELDVSEWRE